MSKQYLTTHVIPKELISTAANNDIFALAVTSSYILTGGTESSIKIWDTADPEHKLVHTFEGAHKVGVHHIAVSGDGRIAASAGFAGEVVLWDLENLKKVEKIQAEGMEGWALTLSRDGSKLAVTTWDGKIGIWNTTEYPPKKEQEYATKGSFGMCVDFNSDGNLIASGHENGGMYIFNVGTGRMNHSLHGLVKSVRSIKFSPGGKLLAAAGDSNTISLFDVTSGEQIASLSGHNAWIFSVSWNVTGEYILSGSFDGKAKVWSTETRTCVATQTESGSPVHAAQWIPKTSGIGESFVTAGQSRMVCFYRETTGNNDS